METLIWALLGCDQGDSVSRLGSGLESLVLRDTSLAPKAQRKSKYLLSCIWVWGLRIRHESPVLWSGLLSLVWDVG